MSLSNWRSYTQATEFKYFKKKWVNLVEVFLIGRKQELVNTQNNCEKKKKKKKKKEAQIKTNTKMMFAPLESNSQLNLRVNRISNIIISGST